MLRCEVGDLSGKHARLNVGSGKQFYTDPSLPLFGEMSGKGKTLTPTYISIVSRGVLPCITKIERKQPQTVKEKKNGFTYSSVSSHDHLQQLIKSVKLFLTTEWICWPFFIDNFEQ